MLCRNQSHLAQPETRSRQQQQANLTCNHRCPRLLTTRFRHLDIEQSSVLYDVSNPSHLHLCDLAFTQGYHLATAAFTAATVSQLSKCHLALPVVVIGGGGGCMSRFFANHLRLPTTAVELCPGVVKVQHALLDVLLLKSRIHYHLLLLLHSIVVFADIFPGLSVVVQRLWLRQLSCLLRWPRFHQSIPPK